MTQALANAAAGIQPILATNIHVKMTRPRWSLRDFDPSEARVTVAVLMNGGWIRERHLLRDRENVYLVLTIGAQDQNIASIRAALTALGIPDGMNPA